MSGFKYSSLDYDAYYDNEHCRNENAAIREILDRYLANGCSVLDLGAGTGLTRSLLRDRNPSLSVTQIEADPEMCKKNPYDHLINQKAETYISYAIRNGIQYDYMTCLFALNYMNPWIVLKAHRVAKRLSVFLVYKNPYLPGSSSYYAGCKALFNRRCGARKLLLNALFCMMRRRIVSRFDLLGEGYYEVVIMR